jgi:hypothetical protein
MDDDVQAFGDQLGRKVLARDWTGVHQMLAPWLQRTLTPQGVQPFSKMNTGRRWRRMAWAISSIRPIPIPRWAATIS